MFFFVCTTNAFCKLKVTPHCTRTEIFRFAKVSTPNGIFTNFHNGVLNTVVGDLLQPGFESSV